MRLQIFPQILVVLVLFICSNIQATSITGDIYLGGKAKSDSRSMAIASQMSNWRNVRVDSDTGSFTAFVRPEDRVSMSGPLVLTSSAPFGLWNVDGFTFDLLSSTIVSQSRRYLQVQGVGTVSGNGFDVTSGDWTATFTKHGRKRSLFGFSFESNLPITEFPVAPASVPDSGSTAALLALGFIGLTLSIARNLTKAHGGSLEAESEERGRGAKFAARFQIGGSVSGKAMQADTPNDSERATASASGSKHDTGTFCNNGGVDSEQHNHAVA